jgi:hypothetical protein
MALVEIARFDDLQEAQIAAGALRAVGLTPLLQNEQWGSVAFFMQRAMGGFRIWTPEEEADDARTLIDACRQCDPAVLDWTRHPQALSAAPATLFWALMDPQGGGWAWARLRRGFSLSAVIVLLMSLMMLGVVFSQPGLRGSWK